MREIFASLQALRAKSVLDKKPKPYVYEYYNIVPLYSAKNSNTRSTLARIFNAVVGGLNDRVRIPRYIMFIIDSEILEAVDHNNFGIQQILSETLDWLARNVDKVIDLRREDVRMKRPGAISSSGEPRLIWTKMVVRPIIQDPTKGHLYAQSRKFNDILEETVQKYKHSHIMELKVPAEEGRLFDKWGNLSGLGRDRYWSSLIQQLKQFDRAETDLRPPSARKVPIPASNSKPKK